MHVEDFIDELHFVAASPSADRVLAAHMTELFSNHRHRNNGCVRIIQFDGSIHFKHGVA
ncbi:MAG: hypothetical protein AAGB07_16525 [Pseudomonadota bacterium]